MKGSHLVIVRNVRVQYKFTVKRNITVLQGDSATGKTTLIEMISDYQQAGPHSGVFLQSDKPCVVLGGRGWERELAEIRDSIVFIDEGNPFVHSRDFARAIQNTDNNYVLVTRIPIVALPYSIMEIYGIRNRTRNKYQGIDRLFAEFYPMVKLDFQWNVRPDIVITEDNNAGFAFFRSYFTKFGIRCIPAGGKSNVFNTLIGESYQTALVIADGAAFGPEIQRISELKLAKNLIFFLPESFEWLILSSDVLKDADTGRMLIHPEQHIEGRDYFSWERFFTAVLTERSRGTFLEYSKRRLNPNYLRDNITNRIVQQLPEQLLSALENRTQNQENNDHG